MAEQISQSKNVLLAHKNIQTQIDNLSTENKNLNSELNKIEENDKIKQNEIENQGKLIQKTPKKQSISLVNKIKKQLTIKWKKNNKVSGYEVVYSANKKFTGKKTVRKAKTTTSYKIKGLKKGKTYYAKVRSYKTVNGKRIYGAYSTAKKATIK